MPVKKRPGTRQTHIVAQASCLPSWSGEPFVNRSENSMNNRSSVKHKGRG